MMNNIYAIVFCLITSWINAQETNTVTKFDTIRKQGYLIIRTGNAGKLGDTGYSYVFIESKKAFPLKDVYEKTENTVADSIYVSTPLIPASSIEAIDLNIVLKKDMYPAMAPIKITKTIDKYDFFEKANSKYRYKRNRKTIYKIVYIDGTWLHVPIVKKWVNQLIEGNNYKMLDPEKKVYDIFFLIDAKINYDVDINDKSVKKVKCKKE